MTEAGAPNLPQTSKSRGANHPGVAKQVAIAADNAIAASPEFCDG
jgi:hypothetical protein